MFTIFYIQIAKIRFHELFIELLKILICWDLIFVFETVSLFSDPAQLRTASRSIWVMYAAIV